MIYYFLLNLGFTSPKHKLKIPEWIKNNHKFLLAFLRGLIDTDFSLGFRSVFNKKYVYPRVRTSMKDAGFISELVTTFKELGFTVYCKLNVKIEDKRGFSFIKNTLEINGLRNFQLWLNKIGTNHPKISKKIIVWGWPDLNSPDVSPTSAPSSDTSRANDTSQSPHGLQPCALPD